MLELEKQLLSTGLSTKEITCGWDDWDMSLDVAFQRCRNYADKALESIVRRQSLFLCGWNGRGKTVSAGNILKDWIKPRAELLEDFGKTVSAGNILKDVLLGSVTVGVFCVADICEEIQDGAKRLDPKMTVHRASEMMRKP